MTFLWLAAAVFGCWTNHSDGNCAIKLSLNGRGDVSCAHLRPPQPTSVCYANVKHSRSPEAFKTLKLWDQFYNNTVLRQHSLLNILFVCLFVCTHLTAELGWNKLKAQWMYFREPHIMKGKWFQFSCQHLVVKMQIAKSKREFFHFSAVLEFLRWLMKNKIDFSMTASIRFLKPDVYCQCYCWSSSTFWKEILWW